MNFSEKFLEQFPKETIYICGIGNVQIRQRIDIFLIVASQIKQKIQGKSIKFFWIGDGYSESDTTYGIWLKEQIHLSNLENDFFVVNTSLYKKIFERSDIFLVTSMEHEPPLFAEEALSSCKPILCFGKGCKLAKCYQKYGIQNFLVADYLDIESLSTKAVNLISNKLVDKKYFSILLKELFESKINFNPSDKPNNKLKKQTIKNIKIIIKSNVIFYSMAKFIQALIFKLPKMIKDKIKKLIYIFAIKIKNIVQTRSVKGFIKNNKILYFIALLTYKKLLKKIPINASLLFNAPSMLDLNQREEIYEGKLIYKDSLPTILVVCHEASATGAPILGLNICKKQKDFNVIVLLRQGGELIEAFKDVSFCIINMNSINGMIEWTSLEKLLIPILDPKKIEYAIVNSFVSGSFIFALKILKVPTILLVHEFAGYCDKNAFLPYLFWASQILFSTSITRDDFFKNVPALKDAANINILPQGKSEPIVKSPKKSRASNEKDSVDLFLQNLSEDAILIMGAGYVQMRKGVGVFIGVANRIRKKLPNKKIKFVWIGGGYSSKDLNLGIWLHEQICLSNLENDLFIIENSPNYQKLLERSDLFLVTSLLDPLPNVAIDALSEAKPTFCFDRGCGLAEYYRNTDLYDELVVSFFDIESMSKKIIDLIKNPEKRKNISKASSKFAKDIFSMKKYIKSLNSYGQSLKISQKKQFSNVKDLIQYDPIDTYFFSKDLNKDDKFSLYLTYTQMWFSEISVRKPFPGFHPGIYKEDVLKLKKNEDPLLHYLKSGCPKGRWSKNVILPSYKEDKNLVKSKNIKVAIHIHVYYLDLLDEILKAISINETKPDLLITTPFQKDVSKIKKKCIRFGLKIKDILVTPNIGRDIGPFISGVGKYIHLNYDFYAHIHTKKAVHSDGDMAQEWREFLISNLLGNSGINMMDKIISYFLNDKNLGLVFPDDPNCCSWSLNYQIAKNFGSKMGLKYFPEHFNFPIGTMFWARKNALSPLFDLNLDWDNYPKEPLPYDGTVLHSIERLIPFINESQGFEYSVTNLPTITR